MKQFANRILTMLLVASISGCSLAYPAMAEELLPSDAVSVLEDGLNSSEQDIPTPAPEDQFAVSSDEANASSIDDNSHVRSPIDDTLVIEDDTSGDAETEENPDTSEASGQTDEFSLLPPEDTASTGGDIILGAEPEEQPEKNESDPVIIDDEELAEEDPVLEAEASQVTWSYKNGVLTISGNGPMEDYFEIADPYTGEVVEKHLPPWKNFANDIKKVIVKEGVTRIGSDAFEGLKNLKKATIASSVTYIRNDAFANDISLTDLDLGDGIEIIEEDVFYWTKLTSLTLPASLKIMGESALIGLPNLQNFYVKPGNSVYQSIDGILYMDGGKTLVHYPEARTGSYRIPDSVTKIASGAFTYTSLSKIIIPDSVTEVEKRAFDYSTALSSITFSKHMKIIPEAVCFVCTALKSVTIPKGIEKIDMLAFSGCDSLESVVIPPSVKEIGEGAFPESTKLTFLNPNMVDQGNGSYIDALKVTLTGNAHYKMAFDVLKLVNAERKKAGVKQLVMDESLLQTAMLRGAETVLYFDHTRPSGTGCFSANPLMSGENIAYGSSTAQGAMNQWMNSPGHRKNILSSDFYSIGIGCFEYEGVFFWVQCFGNPSKTKTDASAWPDRIQKTYDVYVKKDPTYYKAEFKIEKTTLKVGETCKVEESWDGVKLNLTGVVIESSNPSVCSVENGAIKAVGAGTAKITVYYSGYKEAAYTKTINVKGGSSKQVKISFDPNGGTVKTKTKSVTLNGTVGALEKPTRKGYSFSGWYTAKSGGKKVSSSTKVTSSKGMTLYAHWKKVSVGTASVKSLKNVSGKKLQVTINGVSKASGYQVVCTINSKFTKGVVKAITTGASVKISELKNGKTYYVRVRAYKKDSTGAKVYGKYSKAKKIKYAAKK